MNKIEVQYIGVCYLLARISARLQNVDDRDLVGRALADFVTAFPEKFDLVGTRQDGYAIEPRIPHNIPAETETSVSASAPSPR